MKQLNGADKPRHPAEPTPRLFWTLEETATRLGLSVRSFFVLREKHPLYAPDGSRTIIDDPKKDMPLWSDDLVRLIAFARSISSQGVRQLSDDEALQVRNGLGEARRREYLTFAE
ncbi:MAG: hypothetical protein LBS30_07210 [Planctomycetota bacterium]|jgi:hypothetical protein|nr:hypothetical protein [Planctomycetota bacterium]